MSRSVLRFVPLALMLVLPALTGCPSTGPVGFSVFPSAFSFGPSTGSDVLTVAAKGQGTVHWEALDIPAWMQVSPLAGDADTVGDLVTISVNRTGLSAGSYLGEFRLRVGESERTVSVNMTVGGAAAPPAIHASPTTLAYADQESSKSFSITNTGGSTLDWTLTEDLAWLSCSSTTGTVTSGADSDLVLVSVDRSSLTPGVHAGRISLAGNGGTAAVDVSVTVAGPAPVLSVAPSSLDFGTTVATRPLTVSNTGTAALNWTVTESLPWLSVSSTQGQLATGSTPLTVTVDRAGLAAGTYTGQIAVASDGGNATVGVTMTVAQTALVLSPALLQFGSYATNKLLAVGNDGGGTINWSIATGAFPSWLTVGATSGSVTGGTTGVVVSVNRTGQAPGNYEHTFKVTSNGGEANVRVTMSTPATPVLTIDTGFVTPDDQPLVPLGDTDTEMAFTVRNTGTGSLDWSLDPDALPDWLSISPVAGSLTSGLDLVQVTISREGLAPGGYTQDIPVSSNGGNAVLEVTMQVPLRPAIAVEPSEINFGLEGDSSTFFVSNSGDSGTILHFVVVSDKDWLFHSPQTGTSVGIDGPIKDWQQVNLAVDRGGLESSGATGTFTVYAVDAAGEIISDLAPGTVKVSVESTPLSFEGATARTRIPSLIRFIFIMRDFRDRAISVEPADLFNAFTIYEDGVSLEVTETNQFVTSADKLRTNIVVLMDYSGSILNATRAIGLPGATPVQDLYEDLAGSFIDSLPAPWQVALMEFHDRGQTSRVIHDFTTDRDALHTALENHQMEDYGASEILSALTEASGHLETEDQPFISFDNADVRAVVLITDGRVTTPPGDVETTIKTLQTARVRVFPVGWGLEVNNEPLARIASKTGGHYYPTRRDENDLPTVAQLQEKLNAISADLRSQVVFSYATLNEEDTVVVRVNAALNPPNDSPDQGLIQGTFSEEHDYAEIVGDVRLGQVSMRSDGISGGSAHVVLRAEYIPRNVNRFRFTFDTPLAYNVSIVPNADGGILEGWTLTNEGGGSYRLNAPSPLAVLPYGRFGDMLRLDFPTVPGNSLDLFMLMDNTMYLADIEPKYLLHADYLPVTMVGTMAPAFPTMLVSPLTIDFDTDLDSYPLTITNLGGAYPHGVAEPTLQLNWFITDRPSWIAVDVEEGTQDTAYGSDTVTMEVNRSIDPGTYTGYVQLEHLEPYPVPLSGMQTVFVRLKVLPAVLAVNVGTVDLGDTDTEGQFVVSNSGQSTLEWSIDTDSLPDWLQIAPSSGATIHGVASPVSVEINRATLAPGVYSHTLTIASNAGVDTVEVTMTVP